MSTTIHDLKEGTSDCCGAPIYRDQGICSDCKEHCNEVFCDMCEGTGKVEIMHYECSDATGYNTIVEGTGKFRPCPECSDEPDFEE